MLIIALSVIATLGLGAGTWMVAAAIGSVALGAVAIVLAIERAARAQIAAIHRGTKATLHVAKILVPGGAATGNT
jgi:hypothetical protein